MGAASGTDGKTVAGNLRDGWRWKKSSSGRPPTAIGRRAFGTCRLAKIRHRSAGDVIRNRWRKNLWPQHYGRRALEPGTGAVGEMDSPAHELERAPDDAQRLAISCRAAGRAQTRPTQDSCRSLRTSGP